MSTYQRLAAAALDYARFMSETNVPGPVLTRVIDELEFARQDHARSWIVDEIDEYGCPGGCGFDGDGGEHIADIVPDRVDKAASVVILRCEHSVRVGLDD